MIYKPLNYKTTEQHSLNCFIRIQIVLTMVLIGVLPLTLLEEYNKNNPEVFSILGTSA